MENESTFVAPEGVYSVTEEHKHGLMGMHTVNPSNLTYPTKLKTVAVRFFPSKAPNSQVLSQLLGGGREKDSKKEREREKEREKERERAKERDDGLSVSSSETPEEIPSPDASTFSPSPESAPTPSLPHEQLNNIFSPNLSHSGGKKKSAARPKHNMRTTSSTFITRLQNVDNLNRMLQAKQGETTFLFYNSGKSYIWTEAGTKAKGRISSSPCTAVRWVPSSPNLFLVSHADGTIMLYDREREDGVFTPKDPSGSTSSVPSDGSSGSSREDWNPLDSIFVTMPPWHPVVHRIHAVERQVRQREGQRQDTQKPSQPLESIQEADNFVFSPDVKYVAAISEDGCIRIIDAVAEQLVDCYASYFGALTCVAWSPDGRYILTGGQDDLVTIYSPWEQRVVARCQGHSSFVSAVSFDDIRCDGRTYRFGSIGEDNKLILWDFSSGALHRPKLQIGHHQRMSMTSNVSLAIRRRGESTVYLGTQGDSPLPRYHPAPSRNEVAVVQPVLIKQLDGDLMTDIMFFQRGLLTVTKLGHVKLWIRPLAVHPRHMKSRTTNRGNVADLDLLG
ncbi:hypothetical protein NM688_g7778 [Phlebia brevispora]|uniref:Uncharacterized protein n=1 Tax=Phlebia brevispora TaxID=194682 RepID=A0ACC1S181_9APHY|nr:hypothetical protein NM688_g7778 [Phlebia brevispora]